MPLGIVARDDKKGIPISPPFPSGIISLSSLFFPFSHIIFPLLKYAFAALYPAKASIEPARKRRLYWLSSGIPFPAFIDFAALPTDFKLFTQTSIIAFLNLGAKNTVLMVACALGSAEALAYWSDSPSKFLSTCMPFSTACSADNPCLSALLFTSL